jgi:hypothetical protein
MILFGLATTTRRAWLCSRLNFGVLQNWQTSLPRTLFAFFSPQRRSTPSHMEDHPPHRPKYGDIWSHTLPVHVIDPPQQRRVGENSSSIRDPVLRRRVDRSEPGHLPVIHAHHRYASMFAPYVRRRPLEGSPAWPCPNAFLETRFSRRVPAHDRASRGSHVRPASRGFAPAPPSRLSEDPMGMIRPGKGARSDRPVPRAQREWRQRGWEGLARQRQAQSKSGSAPSIDTSTYLTPRTRHNVQNHTGNHGRIGTARAPPSPLCNPRVPPGTRKDSATALAHYPTLSPPQQLKQLHQPQRPQRPQSTPLTCPPRRHGHLNP